MPCSNLREISSNPLKRLYLHMWSMRSVDHFTRKGQPNKVQNSRLKFRDRHNSVLSKSYKAYKFRDTVPQANDSQTDIVFQGMLFHKPDIVLQGILFHKPIDMFPRHFIHLSRIMGQLDNELSSYESPLGFSRSCYHTRHKIDSHSSKHHTSDVRAQIILINFPQIGQFWTFSHQLC